MVSGGLCVFVSTSCCCADEGTLGRMERKSTGSTSTKDNLLASGKLKKDLLESETKITVTNPTTLTGQLVSFGEPRVLKILHAKPISPRVESNSESLVHLFVGSPMRSPFGMMNGSAGFDRPSSPEPDCPSSKSKSSSSNRLNRRTEVKNSAKVAPRLQESIANAS